MVAHFGELIDASTLPRVTARSQSGRLVGLATFNITGASCELVSIDADERRKGFGSHLIQAVEQAAKAAGCTKVWLVTTNNNAVAAAFYIRHGYRLTEVHLDALEQSRKLKPSIPLTDEHGVPLLDEWQFEKSLLRKT